MAQRMESAAPPGGVMLSESTARLVENAVSLDDAEWCDQGRRRSGAGATAACDRRASGPHAAASRVGRAHKGTEHPHRGPGRGRRGRGLCRERRRAAGIGKSRLVRETGPIATDAMCRCSPPIANRMRAMFLSR